MALLRFALLCVDLLAWPAIALGYPLFASIKAIESDSKYHMKKLAIYWTLFSLFSLFEFAFVKFIEWIPFWSSVRLIVIFWLVMPQFDGSNHAYQGLVRPLLLMKLQAVINRFHELREERICKRGMVLDVVEKFIDENGPEAVEKLIALEHENQKWIKSQRETKDLESEEKNAAVTTKQLIEPQAALRDGETVQATQKKTATQSHQIMYAQSTSSVNREDAVVNVKEKTTTPEASADNRSSVNPALMKTQQEWTCGICKVTHMNEMTLNAHLNGSKHKSKIESLKASMLGAGDARPPSPLVQQKQSAAEVEKVMPTIETAEKRCWVPVKTAQQEWNCDLCKVTTTSVIKLNSHFHGSKHKSNLETLKASKLGAKVTVPPHSETSQINQANVCEKFIEETGSELEKIITDKVQIEAKATPPESSAKNRRAKTPPLVKEWTCHLCEVKVTSWKTLNDHFEGSKHKAKLESIKDGNGILRRGKMSEQWCLICNAKLSSSVDVASHLKGKRHASNMEALNSPVDYVGWE